MDKSVADRLWSKVRIDGDCWMWTAGKSNGYGRIRVSGVTFYTHIFVYEDMVAEVPDGLTLDHLCHDPATCAGGVECPHRACLNPYHLDPCPSSVNVLRAKGNLGPKPKEFCIRGHRIVTSKRGNRSCPTCTRDANRRWRAQRDTL